MAGSIGVSDTVTWYTNGWGYRQLIDEAIRVAPPERREQIEYYRVQPGLTLSLLPEADRVPVATTLLRAAQELISKHEHSGDEYQRGYAQKLRDLVAKLTDEVVRMQAGE
ncbi:hypothetical protein ACTMTJ_41760 [Phytohabitans sp. LJ34]|uniref:hypothetical protein n=1 Tax=Phytohabitans sp. LJ34 TaxID=3452217 RepID=UPI003F8CD3F9